jgi:hypothetical protein
MNRSACTFCFLVTVLAWSGCSSQPSAEASKKAAAPLDKIQGKAQVLTEPANATDAALNADGPSVYILEGTRRYRLFLRTAVEVVDGKDYVAEGIWAQKAIDEIGDPDQGKNGYPLEESCQRVVRKAWNNLSFDAIDPIASVVRTRVKRYPARPLFLVTRIRPAEPGENASGSPEPKKDAAAEADLPEISVPAEKERASLIEGPTVQTAPLWDPAGETVKCKVLIGSDGKIYELKTGAQLCESVQWSQFRFQPAIQGGHPVKVATEVEVRFDPRK